MGSIEKMLAISYIPIEIYYYVKFLASFFFDISIVSVST